MNEHELLNEIRKYQFYAVDLNLYLDNFPDNKMALSDYKKISDKLAKLVCQYEKNFGQLTNFGSSLYEDSENWTSSPWPWEN